MRCGVKRHVKPRVMSCHGDPPMRGVLRVRRYFLCTKRYFLLNEITNTAWEAALSVKYFGPLHKAYPKDLEQFGRVFLVLAVFAQLFCSRNDIIRP